MKQAGAGEKKNNVTFREESKHSVNNTNASLSKSIKKRVDKEMKETDPDAKLLK
jgi:hypothetical protein